MIMKKGFPAAIGLLSVLLLLPDTSSAQRSKKNADRPQTIYEVDTLIAPIPLQRQKFHGDIAKALRGADATDGAVDKVIYMGDDTLATQVITQAILKDAAHLNTMIENLPFTDKQTEQQTKIRYLRAVANMLNRFNHDTKIDAFFYRKLVINQRDMIIARHENRLLDFVKENANVYTLNNAELLEGNAEAKTYLYREVGLQNPQMMFRRLPEYAKEPYADEIIAATAKVAPGEVYSYAASTNTVLSGAVRRTKDPLVQTIVRITNESKSPLKAMSFLNDIHTQKLSISEVDRITSNEDLFYKNLVRVTLEQQSLGSKTTEQELAFRGIKIVREMNRLHDSPDPVRFRIVDNFSPEELYFLMIYGVDEIYTSTFTGTFNRMMQRMKPKTGDELLDQVHRAHFRTFIRMSAGYGKLSEFLATIEAERKTALMRDFISGLEKGGEDDLEDAVDVADAFGSISDPVLADFLQAEVRSNYERMGKERNKKGMIVYGLLSTLFNGMRTGNIDGESIGLPPVSMVSYKSLLGDTTVVFEQFYFYGDDDGKMSYSSFLSNFKDGKWKIDASNKNWIRIVSTAGRPVIIFANLPIEGEGKDEEAQADLNKYLASNGIHPTMIVHRGHSYHLPSTLERLTKTTRIVMLGSCGGYHNLGTILDSSPDAQIISTKQVGTAAVNEPIIKEINTHLLAGEDVDWISSWNNLENYFAKVKGEPQSRFKDYVPPHRNLGALFIKAYRRMVNTDDLM
jgi:hypothetical protein